MSPDLKQQAYDFCETFVSSKLEKVHIEINKIKEALLSETKSTAGDKHETGRAMLQLEREKQGQRLVEAEKMQQTLKRVPLQGKKDTVALGSLVRTDKATFFIAVSAGKFENEEIDIFCISAKTPIGKLLLGKTAGEVFEFNRRKSTILEVL
jgi:transcription elongation GreA/GreB family factor